jgi:hypothetical protein
MALDDFIDSAPSVAGFGMTSAACFSVPAAIPLAMMQGTVISDPAQIWHAGSRHSELAGKADDVKAQLKQVVDKRASADKWDGKDKQNFISMHVEPYNKALDQTAALHKGISGSLGSVAKVYQVVGGLSAAIGAIMLAWSLTVDSTALIPGVDLATEGAATAAAETSSGVFRTVLNGLMALANKLAPMLMSIKGLLAMAGLGFGGGLAGKTMLSGSTAANTAYWPGDPMPTAPA